MGGNGDFRVYSRWKEFKEIWSQNLLLSLTVLAVIIGIWFGFILRGQNLSETTVTLIQFPGEIFMQVLKLMILPLIISSLIASLAQMDLKESKQMAFLTIAYYSVTTFFAILTAIILVTVIHPGDPTIKRQLIIQENANISPLDTFLDVLRNMFPENFVQATFQRVKTVYSPQNDNFPFGPNTVLNQTTEFKKEIQYVSGMNILGIIVFCTSFGIVISHLGEKAKLVVEFFVICEAAIMKMVEIFMWFAPIGIICLIAGNLLEVKNLSDTATVLFWYVFTIISGLFIHTVITMPSIYYFVTHKSPIRIMKGMTQAIVTTFGTASSGAALPISMQCVEENLWVDRRISRFILPLGANINLDGNALYEAVAVIFIAQLNNVSLSMLQIVMISFIATIASLGLNSVPVGLVTILVTLNTVGLPVNDVPLIITVDWLLDRIRTAMTVLGDAYVTDAVSHCISKDLKEADRSNRFHQDIQAEIRMLESAAHSRRPSKVSLILPTTPTTLTTTCCSRRRHSETILSPHLLTANNQQQHPLTMNDVIITKMNSSLQKINEV
uniref:Amino acid transporter n=1 Tax=Panagrolaimus sp. ES5 TaxID=591445 RepID=A0AC34GRX6_9BILA